MKKVNLRAVTLVSLLVLFTVTATTLIGRKQSTHAQKIQVISDSPDRFVPGRVLVKFREDIAPAHARNIIAALGARDADVIPNIGVHILDLPYQASEQAFVAAFQGQPEVEFAELDQIVAPADIMPNDPAYASWEWHLQKIQAPSAWSTTTGNSSVIIAILDTGVDGTHEDLASKMVSGWNTYNNNSAT